MNKICLIIPYFGDIPQYSNLFFKSLSNNKNIDVLLFTDTDFELSLKNLRIVHITFQELVHKIQSLFDFKIVLNAPYKLCDYRPAYGLIFKDYLKDYDFWGYCDLDIVMGDFDKFLTPEILEKYDKIYQHGHLSLYKNTDDINREFMSSYGMDYKKVFTTSVNCVFDELLGIQQKFDHDNYKTYKSWDFFDVDPWKYHLTRVTSNVPQNILKKDFDFKHECFYWKNGHLCRIAADNMNLSNSEYIYFHFQKRKYIVPNNIQSCNDFLYLTNDECLEEPKIVNNVCDIDKYNKFSSSQQINFYLKKEIFIWRRRFNKYILKKG